MKRPTPLPVPSGRTGKAWASGASHRPWLGHRIGSGRSVGCGSRSQGSRRILMGHNQVTCWSRHPLKTARPGGFFKRRGRLSAGALAVDLGPASCHLKSAGQGLPCRRSCTPEVLKSWRNSGGKSMGMALRGWGGHIMAHSSSMSSRTSSRVYKNRDLCRPVCCQHSQTQLQGQVEPAFDSTRWCS